MRFRSILGKSGRLQYPSADGGRHGKNDYANAVARLVECKAGARSG